jgi:hypothetical protein
VGAIVGACTAHGAERSGSANAAIISKGGIMRGITRHHTAGERRRCPVPPWVLLWESRWGCLWGRAWEPGATKDNARWHQPTAIRHPRSGLHRAARVNIGRLEQWVKVEPCTLRPKLAQSPVKLSPQLAPSWERRSARPWGRPWATRSGSATPSTSGSGHIITPRCFRGEEPC